MLIATFIGISVVMLGAVLFAISRPLIKRATPPKPLVFMKEPITTDYTYNRKAFLAPDSINSVSAIHCKLYEDGKAIVRISDCHGSIRLWNEVTTVEGVKELYEKIYNLKEKLTAFEAHLKTHFSQPPKGIEPVQAYQTIN